MVDYNELKKTLDSRLGNRVRYRIEGINAFTEDILMSYEINGDDINIVLGNNEVKNINVTDVSYSTYDEKIDIWLYGAAVNRFNIYN